MHNYPCCYTVYNWLFLYFRLGNRTRVSLLLTGTSRRWELADLTNSSCRSWGEPSPRECSLQKWWSRWVSSTWRESCSTVHLVSEFCCFANVVDFRVGFCLEHHFLGYFFLHSYVIVYVDMYEYLVNYELTSTCILLVAFNTFVILMCTVTLFICFLDWFTARLYQD